MVLTTSGSAPVDGAGQKGGPGGGRGQIGTGVGRHQQVAGAGGTARSVPPIPAHWAAVPLGTMYAPTPPLSAPRFHLTEPRSREVPCVTRMSWSASNDGEFAPLCNWLGVDSSATIQLPAGGRPVSRARHRDCRLVVSASTSSAPSERAAGSPLRPRPRCDRRPTLSIRSRDGPEGSAAQRHLRVRQGRGRR